MFCHLSKAGPEELTVAKAPTNSPWLDFEFIRGTSWALNFQLLQRDCNTTIANSPFYIDESRGMNGGHQLNSTHEYHYWHFSVNPELIENNAIYDQSNGVIEICAVASLNNSSVRYEQVLNIPFTPQTSVPSSSTPVSLEHYYHINIMLASGF
jgi:hypothetical protein